MAITCKKALNIALRELALPVEIGQKKAYRAVSCRIVKNSAIYCRYQWQKKNNQIMVNFVWLWPNSHLENYSIFGHTYNYRGGPVSCCWRVMKA